MNRRSFLSGFIGAAAALTLDPERLLWVPGAKTIFVPPVGNRFLTTEMVCREALKSMTFQLDYMDQYGKGYWSPSFSTGSVVNILKPERYGSPPQ